MKKCRVPYTTSELVDSTDRRVVDLSPLGLPEVPVLGFNRSPQTKEGSFLHRHEGCLELTLCSRGSVKFECEGRQYALLPGKVFVTKPSDAHRLRMNQKGAYLHWFFLRLPERDGSLFGLPPDESAFLVRQLTTLPERLFSVSSEVARRFSELFLAYDLPERPAVVRRLRLRTTLVTLLVELAACGHEKCVRETNKTLARIAAQMVRQPEREYSEEWMIHETGLSPNTILNDFRRMTGLPPRAYLVRCRIRRAADRLEKTALTVAEIATQLGFASSQHLATRFRAEMGMTPTEWRQTHGTVRRTDVDFTKGE